MSKLRTDDQNSPEHLIFTIIEVMAPANDPVKAQQWCLHACAGNVYVAKAAYAMVKERYPGKPVMLLDGKRIIGVSWQGT
jgi:hypothetical protein